METNQLKIGTLFSGIGAIEHALDRLNINYKTMFAGDIDPFVKKSYMENYGHKLNEWHNDVTNFSAEKYLNQVDLLVGGSPCQSFSMAGKKMGLDDARGTLFYEYCRVIKECQPKVFIYENVKGLLNHDKGKTWTIVKNAFDELGYKIYHKIFK